MISSALKKIFGSRNDRLLKQYRLSVRAINDLESGLARLSDNDLRGKTDLFWQRFQQGEELPALFGNQFEDIDSADRLHAGIVVHISLGSHPFSG